MWRGGAARRLIVPAHSPRCRDAQEGDKRSEGRAPYDVVLSDLAPKTSGVHGVDEARSLALAERALDLARQVLRPGGAFAVKLFMGAGFEEFRELCRSAFGKVKAMKPEASVARHSKELYLVCQEFKVQLPSAQ